MFYWMVKRQVVFILVQEARDLAIEKHLSLSDHVHTFVCIRAGIKHRQLYVPHGAAGMSALKAKYLIAPTSENATLE